MTPIILEHAGRHYRLGRAVDLSIPLDPRGAQPNAYGVPPAVAEPLRGDGYVLDVAQGGACNCDTLTFTPHCHGTHTESVGHLTHERFPLTSLLPEQFIPATVITVKPAERAIDANAIEIVKYDARFLGALIVRTLPNDPSKKTRRWQPDSTPFLLPEAAAAIRDLGVRHLLVDLPSLDPMWDDGKLLAHRAFWDLAPGAHALPHPEARQRTITEMIYVPADLPDGPYFLTLHWQNLVADAAPSRPLLYFPTPPQDV